jgi:flagellar biosynthesis protein
VRACLKPRASPGWHPADTSEPGLGSAMSERAPRRRAAALGYKAVDPAPLVLAAGAGVIAARIVSEARAAGVPVRRDPALAEALGALELGAQVPVALYAAVAETLAWAYRLDSEARDRAQLAGEDQPRD